MLREIGHNEMYRRDVERLSENEDERDREKG